MVHLTALTPRPPCFLGEDAMDSEAGIGEVGACSLPFRVGLVLDSTLAVGMTVTRMWWEC
jgi:hypothetical protein